MYLGGMDVEQRSTEHRVQWVYAAHSFEDSRDRCDERADRYSRTCWAPAVTGSRRDCRRFTFHYRVIS